MVAHPRLPQIRTCPIRASGSSSRGIATRQRAHPRTAVSGSSPLPAALPLRRESGSVAGASFRTAAHDPIRRFPPPGPRGAGSPTSTVLSADSDFSTPVPPRFVLLRLAVPPRALFAPAGVGRPRGRDCCLPQPSVPPSFGGDVETSQVPGRPLPACPALGPRRNRARPTVPARAVVPSALVTASASATYTTFVAQSRGLQGFLCTLRSRGRPRTTQHSVPAGRSPWPDRTSTCGVA